VAFTVTDSTGLQSNTFLLRDVYAVVFLKALGAIVGMSATYGDAASTSFFTAATQATLTTMVTELVAFAETGPKDHGNGDNPTPGLSTTAPKVQYNAYTSVPAGSGTWGSPAQVTGSDIAMTVAAVYAANPADPLASSAVTWLLAFTANSANATPASNTQQQTLDGITGTYDPTIALATSLQATAPFTEATGALYDLAALGLLSPPLSGLSAATLRSGRSSTADGEQYTTYALQVLDTRFPSVLGRAGLSLQPWTSAGRVYTPDVVLAAQYGAVYRYSNP
jgi:hypothetical protein